MTPPRHALCPACGHMGCEHLAAELEQLRAGRRRFYAENGAVLDLEPEEVDRRRRDAAVEMQRLRAENARQKAALEQQASIALEVYGELQQIRARLANVGVPR